MRFGTYDVEAIIDGQFGLDGGAMFGIVPSPLWQRTNPSDDRNRIELVARCLLIRDGKRNILVETGIGDKFDDKRAEIFKVRHPRGGLRRELEARGIPASAITDVILTHLHFDHCGGTTRRDDGVLTLNFPCADYHLQRRQWEWAHAPSGKDQGSYRREDFALLADASLHLIEGESEIFDGISVHPVDGHTAAMQLVAIRGPERGLLFCADLAPTSSHLRWPYIMAYDNQPLVTFEEKQRWLPAAATSGDVVVFGHDPTIDGAVLRVEDDNVVIDQEVGLASA